MRLNETLNLVIKNCLEKNIVPFLIGEPGIGKSSWLKNLSKTLNTKVFTLACNQLGDKTDITGARLIPYKDTYTQAFYPHVIITKAIEYAKEHPDETPILFLDEINRTTEDITSTLLSIPTDRNLANTDLPENLKVVLAGNDKGNINTLDDASISRFFLINVEPDYKTYLDVNPNLYQTLKTFILKKQTVFYKENDSSFGFIQNEAFTQFLTPRTLTALSDWLNLCDDGLIKSLNYKNLGEEHTVLEQVIYGFIGKNDFSYDFTNYLLENINKNNETTIMFENRKGPENILDELKQILETKEDFDEREILSMTSNLSFISLDPDTFTEKFKTFNSEFQKLHSINQISIFLETLQTNIKGNFLTNLGEKNYIKVTKHLLSEINFEQELINDFELISLFTVYILEQNPEYQEVLIKANDKFELLIENLQVRE